MAQVKRETPNYLLIGIFLFFGIVSIVLGVVVADKLIYQIKGGYPLKFRFNQLDGLSLGAKVNIRSGKDIGTIESIEVDGSQLIVTAVIDKKYKINRDAVFQIYSTSFVGGKYLAVENYTGQAPFYSAGEIITGIDPFSLNSVLSSLGNMFSSASDTNEITQGLGAIFHSVNNISGQLEKILKDNNANINTTLSDIAKASVSLKAISVNLERKLNTISDKDFTKIVDDLQNSISNLNIFLEDINSPNAPLSILKDPQINHSLRTIVTNLEETTQRVKAKPSLLLKS